MENERHPLRAIMEERKLSLGEAADRLGVSVRQFKKYLAGRIIIPLYVERLLELNALGHKVRFTSLTMLVRQWEERRKVPGRRPRAPRNRPRKTAERCREAGSLL